MQMIDAKKEQFSVVILQTSYLEKKVKIKGFYFAGMLSCFLFCFSSAATASDDLTTTDIIKIAHDFNFNGCGDLISKTFKLANAAHHARFSGAVPDGNKKKHNIFNAYVVYGIGSDVVKNSATFIKTGGECYAFSNVSLFSQHTCTGYAKKYNLIIKHHVGDFAMGDNVGGNSVVLRKLPYGNCYVTFESYVSKLPSN